MPVIITGQRRGQPLPLMHGVQRKRRREKQTMRSVSYTHLILAEPYAKGTCISIAVAGKHQIQDAGAKMIHLADHTYSNIVSKSVSRNGGEVNYRGLVLHGPNAAFAKSKVECDTLILDKQSRSDTIPTNISKNMLESGANSIVYSVSSVPPFSDISVKTPVSYTHLLADCGTVCVCDKPHMGFPD